MIGVLATVPSSTELMGQIGSYSAPLFSDLLPFAEFAIGIFVGAALVLFLIMAVSNAVNKSIHKQ